MYSVSSRNRDLPRIGDCETVSPCVMAAPAGLIAAGERQISPAIRTHPQSSLGFYSVVIYTVELQANPLLSVDWTVMWCRPGAAFM